MAAFRTVALVMCVAAVVVALVAPAVSADGAAAYTFSMLDSTPSEYTVRMTVPADAKMMETSVSLKPDANGEWTLRATSPGFATPVKVRCVPCHDIPAVAATCRAAA